MPPGIPGGQRHRPPQRLQGLGGTAFRDQPFSLPDPRRGEPRMGRDQRLQLGAGLAAPALALQNAHLQQAFRRVQRAACFQSGQGPSGGFPILSLHVQPKLGFQQCAQQHCFRQLSVLGGIFQRRADQQQGGAGLSSSPQDFGVQQQRSRVPGPRAPRLLDRGFGLGGAAHGQQQTRLKIAGREMAR